jgi:hypothetical protein
MKKKYLFLIIFLFPLLLGCGRSKGLIMKDGLEGVWKTEYPDYKGCSFAVTKDLVIFSNKYELKVLNAFLLKHIDINFILKVKKEVDHDTKISYKIFYESVDRKKYEFAFDYDPTDGGTIKLANQPQMVWKKEHKLIIEEQPVRPKWYKRWFSFLKRA